MNFRHGERIEIIYINKEGEFSQRHIRVIVQRDEKLFAYCYTKKKIRTFNIENILATKKVSAA